jgi:hypothetical protein
VRHLRWIGPAGALTAALLLAAPLAARPGAIPGGNLVQNPGAEASPGTVDDIVVKPAGWTTTGALSVWKYPTREGDRPTTAFAATIGGGENFFSGGPGGVMGQPTASQTIDVSGAATEIDAGQVGATLTAFIGGYTVSEDLATVSARFLDAAGASLGSVRIGPVNRDDRKRLTVLLRRSAQANIPKSTRNIGVVIEVTVDNNGKNHAYVDNISLTLAKASSTPLTTKKATLTVKCSAATLVATVKPAAGQKVKRVTFTASGRKATDTKAPFTARFPTKGLPAQILVKAKVVSDRPVQNLSKKAKRC